jgi:uncharacterized protein with von Willebrand factor type A (vWA) domain
MKPLFEQFGLFGNIADSSTRYALAGEVYEKIQTLDYQQIKLPDTETQQYSTVLNEILRNPQLRKYCAQNAKIAGDTAHDLLNFINNTERNIQMSDIPVDIAIEMELLQEFQQLSQQALLNEEQEPTLLDKYLVAAQQHNPESAMLNGYIQGFDIGGLLDIPKFFQHAKQTFVNCWKGLLRHKQLQHELQLIELARRKFCEELYKRFQKLQDLQEMFDSEGQDLGRLWDLSRGNWQHINFDLMKHYANLLQQDEVLQALAKMLGRMDGQETEFVEDNYQIVEKSTEWKTRKNQKSELIGVHVSNDLNNLLPFEVALLAESDTEMLFLSKWVEQKLQTFEYQGRVRAQKQRSAERSWLKPQSKFKEKGPIILCVDTSGSMHGAPETVAKTLCFAILRLALSQQRKCYLISFSTSIETLNLSNWEDSMEKLLQFLAMSFHGGTDATPAVRESLKMLETKYYEKADVLMISDFVMSHFDATTKAQIQTAKAKKTKFHSLVIGSSQNQGVISDFDNTWIYDPNNRNAMITLVEHLSKMRKDSF